MWQVSAASWRPEAGTFAALKERRVSVLEPILRVHSGRIVKVMGDGALVEFSSALSAVTAAVDLQRKMAEANAELPDARRIVLRIGINLGDVIGEGKDIYGEGVNLAARLQTLAEPGGICISGKVFEEIRGKIASTFEDMGEQRVKNIERPVRTYRLRPAAVTDSVSPSRPALPLPDKPSIAVLPFQNMSGDTEQDYFADIMVEEIITARDFPLILLPLLVHEFFRRIGLGEGNDRHLDLQEFAQRPPAVAQIESQQSVGRNFGLDIGDMFPEHAYGVIPV